MAILERINIRKLTEMLRKGIDEETFEEIKNLPIISGTWTAGRYIQHTLGSGDTMRESGKYRFKEGLYGIVQMKQGGKILVPSHIQDPESHNKFVKNAFSTLRQ